MRSFLSTEGRQWAMIASLFTHNPLIVFEWFLGIFLGIVFPYKTPLIRTK